MISTADFKTGLTILYEGEIYQIIEFLHSKTARSAANVVTKLRNLRTGAVVEKTFRSGEKMEQANIEKRPMQYLYDTGSKYVFMNMETYEQVEINISQIEHEKNFIYEGLSVDITYFNGTEILGLVLPEKVSLLVAETAPGVKGDTKTNASKDAIMETGLLVKVPLFVDEGDRLIISTADGSYVSRDNK
ncbi:MAG TPA: elongation factor P [Acholeplasma sp.]|jgi:elongation factor P|nr:elongation factor P [Acholeplasmatales bacterium]HHV33092.1 elongation factor P [Acholeplasma sp.]